MQHITNEMRERAEKFILDWRGTTDERAEAQTFTNEFFEIFGLKRRDYAQFEKPIQKKDETGTGFADLFWSGKLIIESKSAYKDSDVHWQETLRQANDYVEDLFIYQRPQYILLMNFKRFQKHKVETIGDKVKITFLSEIKIEELADKLDAFSFFPDFAHRLEDDGVILNQEAARRMANLYEAIEHKGYNRKDISILLARILFCLFAEDTGIFEKRTFEDYIRDNTDGNNLGEHLMLIFKTLDTPPSKRQTLNKKLIKFHYVNGGLFDEKLTKVPPTTKAMREALLECCTYDWSDISPVIFGSLFQAVIHEEERRSLGAHYTSEKNILRVVNPLFLDKLHEEFEEVKDDSKALEKFRKKINSLMFLDPACGCGNFLVVTYRELRLLDMEIIQRQFKGKYVTDVSLLSNVRLENFHGYEIDQTSAMIAEVAMWLTEHQMNMRLESEFGKTVPTIPLDEAAVVINNNSLHIDWATNKNDKTFDFILGNPPFIGKQYQTTEQKKDIEKIFKNVKGAGVLDYVTCWYIKAAEYMQKHSETRTALVSTNSIAQGEQTGILWNELFNNYGIKIQFAHQTFKWHNEAEGVAGVHCVVVGFGLENFKDKYIFEYDDIKAEPKKITAKNINPYLVQGDDTVILKTRKPICSVPEIYFGSMPNDGGHLLLDDDEKKELIKQDPNAKKWVRPLISAHEYLNGKTRWCLWLEKSTPAERKHSTPIYKRVLAVKKHREESDRDATNKLASIPFLFGEIRQPNSDFIFIPLTSSENRYYIPLDIIDKKYIANNSCGIIPKATSFHFGVLTSVMHMTWVRYVCGRLESRYRYSNEIVYNNFPWPLDVSKQKKQVVEKAAEAMLTIRQKHIDKGNTLADLYDPANMPADLQKAHEAIDKAVDKCYRDTPFKTEPKRMEYLFNLYGVYTATLFSELEKGQTKKKKNN
jgi:type I restriction-modification system DNA methylase subunit